MDPKVTRNGPIGEPSWARLMARRCAQLVRRGTLLLALAGKLLELWAVWGPSPNPLGDAPMVFESPSEKFSPGSSLAVGDVGNPRQRVLSLWRWNSPLWRGRYSGMRAAMAGSTRLKVVNKPLKDLIIHFSTFIAKEQTSGDSYSFFVILEAKGHLPVAIDRPRLED
uniref:Uncharacterized protein n=1 Tax=Solanum tuberosum TaxID=4113 RepID=M1DWQ4_SOLTU